MPARRWLATVEGFKAAVGLYDEDKDNCVESRDAIVAAITVTAWYGASEAEFGELYQLVEELKDADTVDWVDAVLNGIYDLADDDRVWLA